MENKSTHLTTLFEPSDLQRVKDAAKSDGMKASTWLRVLALREINSRKSADITKL